MSLTLRPSQAISIWQNVSLDIVREGEDLSMRQLAILLTVYLEAPPHTVRGLATRLNVTKPAITRALETMGQKKLLKRHRDPEDGRNVLIQRTVEGSLYVERLGDRIVGAAEDLDAR